VFENWVLTSTDGSSYPQRHSGLRILGSASEGSKVTCSLLV
jgi:hypothetical protein